MTISSDTTTHPGYMKGQVYCKRSKQATSALVFGEEVTLKSYGKDKDGRTLADVLLPDGINVNHELVKEGWCWWYRKYAPGDTRNLKLRREWRNGDCGKTRIPCRRG